MSCACYMHGFTQTMMSAIDSSDITAWQCSAHSLMVRGLSVPSQHPTLLHAHHARRDEVVVHSASEQDKGVI